MRRPIGRPGEAKEEAKGGHGKANGGTRRPSGRPWIGQRGDQVRSEGGQVGGQG